jgi:transglutaminase-like putative cysteine protease
MGTIYLASNVMAPAGVEGMLCRVGCEFVYESTAATPAIAQVYVRPDGEHRIVAERCASDPELAVDEYVDAFGNRCGRLVIPEGPSTLRYDALVEVTGEADLVVPDADQCAPDALPPETILYLLPSRYCQSDRLLQVAWDLFGATEPGWSRVQAVCDWVHTNLTFMRGSVGLADAVEVYLQRRGVCRDFAHLGVTFCRALNIPARYGFGYMGDIGIPAMDAAMDFHAWFEVFLGGRWYTFDCRHNTPRIGRIFIGRGRDAVDVAMMTTFGPAQLRQMTVWADEVAEGTTLED